MARSSQPLLASLLLLLLHGASAYSSGTRSKSIHTNTIHAFGLDAGLCEVSYTISCSLPCYASVMTINELQSFSDRLYNDLPGELCSDADDERPGAVTQCSDKEELSPLINCANFQAYNLVVYFNATSASGEELELEYELEFESERCGEEECPNPTATS